MNKCIILCMSCNINDYVLQRNIIKETWGKPILEGKYENLDLWFYTSSDHNYIDITNHIIYTNTDDTDTWGKTYECFNILNKFFNYNYLVRTNTSTVINIQLLSKLLEVDILQQNIIYTSSLLTNVYKDIITPIGYFMMLSKNIITKIYTEYNLNKEYYDNNIIIANHYYDIKITVDDAIIGFIVNEINKKNNTQILYNVIRGAFYKTIPKNMKYYEYEYALYEDRPDLTLYNKAICVRCKPNILLWNYDRINAIIFTINNINDISNIYNQKINDDILYDAIEYIRYNINNNNLFIRDLNN